MVRGRIAILIAGCLSLQACMAARPGPVSAPQSSGAVRKQMADALESGDARQLARSAITLARMGASLSDATFERIAPHLDRPALADQANWWGQTSGADGLVRLRREFGSNAELDAPGADDLVATVPAEYRLVEGIAGDTARKRLFVGTVVDGRLAYMEGGKWHEVPIGLPRGGLFGMAIDSKRNLLWIATGPVEQTAVAGERMSGLIVVDLETLKVVRRVPVPGVAPGTVGDVTVRSDGSVFASNSVTGAIHRCTPGCKVLEELVPPGRFGSPQGLALSSGGTRLYVADYGTGLWMIVARTGEVKPVKLREPAMLDGIDGLVSDFDPIFRRDGLIAIQNGTRPRRIVRIAIGNDPDIVLAVDPWLRISPDGPEPTLGTLRDGDLFYVGDAQWERYGPGGVLKDGQPPRPTPILRARTTEIIIT